jgi:TetR/AcrR family transcriptional regulator, transcriptional repressor for nem operon
MRIAGMKRRAHKRRDPERTRERLLQAAFREVYRSGFQGTGVDAILAAAGVTKGALYHHFDSKETLAYAMVEEVIAGITRARWVGPLESSSNPIDTLIEIVQRTSLRREDVCRGCPLNNLAQEMSPLDEGLRKRTARVFQAWQEGIAKALRRGQTKGTVRRDLEPSATASFLIATYEGYISLAKNAQDADLLQVGIRNIVSWLRLLAPAGQWSEKLRASVVTSRTLTH